MQTSLDPKWETLIDLTEVDTILRSCVHCGFCTSGCPTYQLLGDENDSPRGRIYLMKQVFEHFLAILIIPKYLLYNFYFFLFLLLTLLVSYQFHLIYS